MPPTSASSMSLGELATCEDFLVDQRAYATGLLGDIENISQWHRTDSCPETRKGRTCALCALCSADGLMGTAKMALASYDDAEKCLKTVRASLGKSASSHASGAPGRETLFQNSLAKSVFFSIIMAGDTLRSQHAAWQARLQSEVVAAPLFAHSPQHITRGPGASDQNSNGDLPPPTYPGAKVVRPESDPNLTAMSTSLALETTSSSSMFIVLQRCLSSDCPCDLNKENVAAQAKWKDVCGSQVASKVPPSRRDSKKTRPSKATAKSEATTRGGGTGMPLSTTTNLERPSRKTSDLSNTLAKPKSNAQTQKPSTHRDPNSADTRASDAPRQNDAVPEEQAQSSPTSDAASSTQETKSCSSSPECDTLIVDPRIFRLRAQIVRADDARRVLMEWCRASRADLQLGPLEKRGLGPDPSLTTIRGTRRYPSALAHTLDPGKSPCTTGQPGDDATKGRSYGDDETMVQEPRCNAQEELRGRWLTARQKRCTNRKRRSS
ncbi:hypothetical protein OG21DRAFT_806703 [Imleria badia]|nr:hypothetical protein OG21DRAFT_806703 [Imleria badia]